MPPAPPTIHRSFFFLHGGLQHALWCSLAISTHATARHPHQEEDRLRKLSDCPFARRIRNTDLRVSSVGARIDSIIALHWRIKWA